MAYWRIIAAATLIHCFAGCGGGKMKLSGDVSFDGKPVEKGKIVLTPIGGTRGSSVGAAIEKGRFLIPAAQGAPVGGEYKVEIAVIGPSGRKIPNIFDPKGPPLDENTNIIPARYNVQSILRVKVSPAPAENHFEFALEKS